MKIQESIALAEVQPGMLLAVAVLDDTGRLLVPAGAEINDAMLQSLLRRNIARLIVERGVTDDPVASAARRLKIEETTSHLFRRAGEGVETTALRQAITVFRLERGQ